MSKKAIDLLEKARGVYSGYGSSERYVKLLLYLDQALTLLKQQTTETSIGNNVREIAKKDKLGVTGFVSDKVILNQAANRLDVWWKYIGELKEQIKQQPTALNSCPYPPCKGEGKLQKNAGIYYVYCKNCGRHTDSFETNADAIKAWNNTNKSEQPTAGEYTKEWRRRLENAVNLYKMGKNPNEWFQSIVTGFSKACDIIDTLESENQKLKEQRKDLLEACKYSHTLLLRKIGQATHAVALLEVAISKVQKED